MIRTFFLISILIFSGSKIFSQTYSWSGYTSGATTYTTGIMTSTLTSTSPGFQNTTPRYYSGATVGSGQCGIAGGLALENMFGNVTNAHATLTIDFTSGNTTNGTCATIQFQIKDINADESNQTFRDLVYISAVDGNNTNIPVANITATGGSNKYITTSGNSRLIHGSTNSSYGSRSSTACDNVTITVTPPSGVPLKRIVIRYQPSYEAASGTTGYWNFTGPYRPAFQYISISSLTATATLGCVVLPVELTRFDVNCESGKKIINWETASETNNDFFIIEGSETGDDFIPLKRIEGRGNSSASTFYETEIEDPKNQYRYFRLKQTDLNGSFQYSEIRYTKCESDYNILLYPNPASSQIIISEIDIREIPKYKIFDMTGRLVMENKFQSQDSNNSMIDITELPLGCYTICMYNQYEERIQSIPFIKE